MYKMKNQYYFMLDGNGNSWFKVNDVQSMEQLENYVIKHFSLYRVHLKITRSQLDPVIWSIGKNAKWLKDNAYTEIIRIDGMTIEYNHAGRIVIEQLWIDESGNTFVILNNERHYVN